MKLELKYFKEFPELRSDRLFLRKLTIEDAKSILEIRTTERVNQFIFRPPTDTLDKSIQLINKTLKAYSSMNGIAWAGVLRDNKEIIGTCGFNSIDILNRRAEIGGEMSIDYWGKGIAQEAFKMIIEFAFNKLNLHTIEAKVLYGNRSAIRILEDFGFEKEAHFKERVIYKNEFYDMLVYTLFSKK